MDAVLSPTAARSCLSRAIAVVTVVGGLLLTGGPAAAQGADDGVTPTLGPAARLHVAAISVSEGSDDASPDLGIRAFVENRRPDALHDLALLVEVFAAVQTRNELHLALDQGTPTTAFLDAGRVDLDPLPPMQVAGVEVVVPGDDIGWSENGVHPVRITIVQGREALDEVTSAAIIDRGGAPLEVVVGWPLDAPPSRRPGGVYPDEAVAGVAPGSRLERLVWALGRAPGLLVQPLLGGHAFEDVADMADGFLLGASSGPSLVPEDDSRALAAAELLARAREVIADRAPPLAGPYADADLSGLAASGLAVEAVQHVADGPQRLERALGTRPVPGALWVTAPLTTQAVRDVVGPARVRTLLLSWSQLDAELPERTPAPIRRLLAGGTEITVVVGDPWLEQLLAALPTRHGPQVAAQRVLAETAMVHLERPFDGSRGLVLLPPPLWDPDPRAAVAVLEALRTATWLRPVAVESLVAGRTNVAPTASLVATEGSLSAEAARSLGSARTRLGVLQDALVDPGLGIEERRWLELDTQLLRAASFWLVDRGEAQQLVDDVSAAITSGFGTVALADGASVTLTAEEGKIPISLSRTEGAAIRVIVEVESSKLDFPEGRTQEITLDRDGKRTISFATVAHASGRVPVTVRVIAPSGEFVLDATTVVVRSSHVSTTALAVLGAVLAVLLVWWLVRRRHPRPPQLRLVEEEAA